MDWNTNTSIAVVCLSALAGAVWRAMKWLAARAEKYLDHRIESEVKLVEHVGVMADAILTLHERVPAGQIAEIHAALVGPK